MPAVHRSFTFVEPKRCDVDKTYGIWCIGTQGGHDLPTVGVPNDNGRTVLAIEDLAEPAHVGFELSVAMRKSPVMAS